MIEVSDEVAEALLLMRREEEQLFLVTLEHLSEAMNSLTDIQARRIHARYILGKKLIEIAAEEGVSVFVVQQTVKSGLKRMWAAKGGRAAGSEMPEGLRTGRKRTANPQRQRRLEETSC